MSKRIHVAIFQTLGDVLMATPIVHAIREKHPSSIIYIYTKKEYIEVWDNNPDVNQIIPANNYEEFYEHIYKIKKDTPNKEHIVVPLAMKDHLDTLWHHTNKNISMIDWYASRVPKKLGIEVPLKNKHINFNSLLEPVAWQENLYIVVHTSSRLESKDWPIEYWNQLVDKLVVHYPNHRIYQIGLASDKKINHPKVQFYESKSLAETACVIKLCKFYIGIDSGPAYLAEAMNKQSFIIMGASSGTPREDHTWVGPQSNCITYIEPNRPDNINCSPQECVNHCVLNKPCINSVSPERVESVIINSVKTNKT